MEEAAQRLVAERLLLREDADRFIARAQCRNGAPLYSLVCQPLEQVMFKIEVQEENGLWHDVRGSDGKPLTFTTKPEAQAMLAEMFPVLVKMEQYAGGKRTRVIAVIEDHC